MDGETGAWGNSNQLVDGGVNQQACVFVQRLSANGYWGFTPTVARHRAGTFC